MKKIVLTLCLLLCALFVQAQSYKLVFADDIPAAAREVLSPRLGQMLRAQGLSLGEEGLPLRIEARVVSCEKTAGDFPQTALSLELKAQARSAQETFPLKAVGDSEEDAWIRACKQFLPHSKAARAFAGKLGE